MSRLTRLSVLKQILVLLVSIVVIVVAVIVTLRLVLNSVPRTLGNPMIEGISIEEFVELPDDDSYPYAIALAPDGTVYTASYTTGTVWAINTNGEVTELPSTREQVGSVTGLDVAPDGTLHILDRIAPLQEAGGIVWRVADDGLEVIVNKDNSETGGFVLPEDIAIDGDGRIYVSDRGPDRVWRFDADGENGTIWWSSPRLADATDYTPMGLAYDSVNEALVISDSLHDLLYRVSLDAENPREETELLYQHNDRDLEPGFDGVTVTDSGEIYVAGLGLNRVYHWRDGELIPIARDFRQASDVVVDSTRNLLYVTNFNGAGIGIGTSPLLPFALDVIDLSPDSADG